MSSVNNNSFFRVLLVFSWKLICSSLFAWVFFLLLIFGKFVTTFWLHFYDFLFLSIFLTQVVFILTKFESWDDVKIILIFHILWFIMEAFKVHPWIGAWSYPDPWFFTLLNVPLYSGFMYSAVGSFIFKAWGNLQLKFTNFPKFKYIVPMAIITYINFFSHHILPDIRYIIVLCVVLVARKTFAWFSIRDKYYKMPVLLGLFFSWFFLWLAENIATFFWAWVYPYQNLWWTMVSWHKILSWFLFFIVSIVVISSYKMKFWEKMDEFTYFKD